MNKPTKPIPKFTSEAQERAYWEKHDFAAAAAATAGFDQGPAAQHVGHVMLAVVEQDAACTRI